MKVLYKVAKLDIEINKIIEDSNILSLKETEISDLLNKKKSYSFINLDKINLFIFE